MAKSSTRNKPWTRYPIPSRDQLKYARNANTDKEWLDGSTIGKDITVKDLRKELNINNKFLKLLLIHIRFVLQLPPFEDSSWPTKVEKIEQKKTIFAEQFGFLVRAWSHVLNVPKESVKFNDIMYELMTHEMDMMKTPGARQQVSITVLASQKRSQSTSQLNIESTAGIKNDRSLPLSPVVDDTPNKRQHQPGKKAGLAI
jgi:hypothetical protein